MSIRSLILPLYTPSLLLAICRGLLVPILPLYAQSFEVSFLLIGIVLGSQSLGTMLGDVPAGILYSRLGKRGSMVAGLTCLALAMLAMASATAIWMLALYGLIAGFGMALWNVSRFAYIASSVATGERGRAIAIFGGVSRIGVLIGPVIGGTLAQQFGLRAPFLLYAILAALGLIFPLFFVSGKSGEVAIGRGGLRGHGLHVWQVVRSNYRTLTPAGIGQMLAQMIRAGRDSVLPLYGATVIGLSPQDIGWVISAAAFVDMSMFPIAGYVMDRFGRKFAYVPCFAIQGLAMLTIPLTSSYVPFLIAAMMIGFGNGLGSGTMMTLGADLAPRDDVGEFLGVWRLIGDGGASASPMIFGRVADMLSLGPATVVIGVVGLLAAATFFLFVPETLQRAPRVTATSP